MFSPAVKHAAKLRMAIAGPSGSGKTYTSLAIATALANGGKIAVVDTEHGSASKYADLFAFDVLNLEPPFHPNRFVEAMKAAGAAGYTVLVIDSLTHAWNGTGGLLEIVDQIAARMKTSNTFAAWKDATPIHNGLVEGILSAPLHVIATMRSKQDYIQEVDDRGKQRIRKVGMAPVQREGFEYEFDVFLDMDMENNGIISKTRCPDLTNGVFHKPGADIANILLAWLQGQPAPAKPAPAAPPPVAPKPNGNGQQSTPQAGPRLPEALRNDLQTAAASLDAEPPMTKGWDGALVGHLDKLTDGKHRQFLMYAFSLATGSSAELSNGQWHALRNWLSLTKADDGKWYPGEMAAAECRAVMAFMAPARESTPKDAAALAAAELAKLAAANPQSAYAQQAAQEPLPA